MRPIQDPHYVFVTGTRNREAVNACIDDLARPLSMFDAERSALVHGGYWGVDLTCAQLTERFGWRGCLGVPAQWDAIGRQAGPLRNAILVQFSKMLHDYGHEVSWLAFPTSSSIGTWHTVKLAREAGFDPQVTKLNP